MTVKFSQATKDTIASITPGGLIGKNVRIDGKRTSVRLESEMWDALHEISEIELCTIHDLCTAVNSVRDEATSFTAALRVFLMQYYRTAAMTDHKVNLVRRRLRA